MRRKVPPSKWPRPSHLILVGSEPKNRVSVGLWLKVGAVIILIAFAMLTGVSFVALVLTEMAKAALR